MMTGVPPHRRVEDVIAEYGSLSARLSRWMKKRTTGKDPNKRKKKYRLLEDLPGDIYRLISQMTEKDFKNRLSVRAARRSYPWIFEVSVGVNDEVNEELVYLDCALKHSKT